MKLKLIIPILLISNLVFGQSIYKGKVVDVNTNQPIEGVSLRIEGQNRGTVTDLEGEFSIEIEKLPSKIIISHVGYEVEEKEINSIREKKEII